MVAAGRTLARSKVVAWCFHLLAMYEGIYLLGEQGYVHGVNMLKVVIAIGIARRVDTVDKVVVGRYGQRAQATSHKLHAEALAESGFATRRGAGYEYHLELGVGCYAVGQVGNFLFLQSLAHVDKVVGVTVAASIVELADGGHTQYLVPAMLLTEHFKHFGLFNHGAQL